LYTRVRDHRGLLLGWAAGILTGTWMAASLKLVGSIYPLHIGGYTMPGYAAAVRALLVNIGVAIVVSMIVRVLGMSRSEDRTRPEDYLDVVESET
jgi:SSS family solute:Na+ symporter